MENPPPPPTRPWFRLASQIRVEPPPQPRPFAPVRPPTVEPPPQPLAPIRPPTVEPPPQPRPLAPIRPPIPQTIRAPAIIIRLPQPQQPQPQPQPSQPQPQQPPPPQPQPQPTQFRSSAPSSPMQRGSVPPSPPQPKTITQPEPQPTQTRRSPPPSPVQTRAPAISSMPPSPMRKNLSPPPSLKPITTDPQPFVSSWSAPRAYQSVQTSPVQKSPPPKSSVPPLSPLTLPPTQLKPVPEPESKSVVVAEHKSLLEKYDEFKRNEGENKHGNIHHREKKEGHKKKDDHEDNGLRFITIAGENKGAYMEIGHSKKGNTTHPNHGHGHFLNKKSSNQKSKDGNESESNSSSSSRSSKDSKSKKKDNKAQTPPMTAYVNSNVQAVNNSLLFDTTCTHTDPGVHLKISRSPAPEHGMHVKHYSNGHYTD